MTYTITVHGSLRESFPEAAGQRSRTVRDHNEATAVFVGEAACLIGTYAQSQGLTEGTIVAKLGDLRDQVAEWTDGDRRGSLTYFPADQMDPYVTITRY